MNDDAFEFHAGRTALLISVPHAGLAVPDDIRARLTPAALRFPDTDWHVPLLYEACREIGASMLIARNSRYVVDLNRPPDGTPLYPGQTETALCPTRSFGGHALYQSGQEPGPAELRTRLEHHWQPYHRKLAEVADTLRTQHGHCVLWDAHSIKSNVPAFFAGKLPDLNVGSADGRSCSRSLSDRVMQQLRSQSRFTSILNGRFKGGYITRHYGDPARGVDALQLEIAQSAYLDEAAPQHFDSDRAAALRTLLYQLLAAVTNV